MPRPTARSMPQFYRPRARPKLVRRPSPRPVCGFYMSRPRLWNHRPVGTERHPPHPLRPYAPLLVNAALTGMVAQRDRVPHVPLTADEIVRDAWLCHNLGATILHLHARDADGRPEWRRAAYEELVPRIRGRCPEAIICVSTSGREFPELERRADVLRLDGDARPDMASLTLGSLNFRGGPSVNAPETIEALARRMLETGIKPELEVFDSGMAHAAHNLLEQGVLETPLYANLMLGSHHTAPARAKELAHLVDSLPERTVWAAAGIGAFQLPMNAIAVFMGGHVRTGLEDNVHLDRASRTPASNAALVERVAEIAALAGRPLASAAEVREWLRLPARPGRGYRIRPAALPGDRRGMLEVLATANMHHVPSAEMNDFDVGTWLVAESEAGMVGVAGFVLMHDGRETVGKTTLLAVPPANRKEGIGAELQELRMELMRRAGAARVVTNADRPETIDWYKRRFGYREVGHVLKRHEFGLPEVDRWTTLEASLR